MMFLIRIRSPSAPVLEGAKAMAARCSYTEQRFEPGRLAMAARYDCSVRVRLTNSEFNDEGAGLELSWREPSSPVVA